MQSCVSHESPWQLHVHVKKLLLPFLRSSALFFHFLTEIAGPTALKGQQYCVLKNPESFYKTLSSESDVKVVNQSNKWIQLG